MHRWNVQAVRGCQAHATPRGGDVHFYAQRCIDQSEALNKVEKVQLWHRGELYVRTDNVVKLLMNIK